MHDRGVKAIVTDKRKKKERRRTEAQTTFKTSNEAENKGRVKESHATPATR